MMVSWHNSNLCGASKVLRALARLMEMIELVGMKMLIAQLMRSLYLEGQIGLEYQLQMIFMC